MYTRILKKTLKFDELFQFLQWLENEKQRLGHLRDRASETGCKKQYPFFIKS
jgi:hypothetical protein